MIAAGAYTNCMLTAARRFLVFQAFLLWQGGFLFYASVVVPIGTAFLGSPKDQGLITQKVTDYLNLFGGVWAALFLWDVYATRDPNGRRKLARWLGWAVCVGLLGVLVWLHGDMDALIDREAGRLTDRKAFRAIHIAYLWVTTGHWLVALALAWLTLGAWRGEDRSAGLQCP
jgi:hypothetical protein